MEAKIHTATSTGIMARPTTIAGMGAVHDDREHDHRNGGDDPGEHGEDGEQCRQPDQSPALAVRCRPRLSERELASERRRVRDVRDDPRHQDHAEPLKDRTDDEIDPNAVTIPTSSEVPGV